MTLSSQLAIVVIVFAAIVVVSGLLVLASEERDREAFHEGWPPISDDEFLEACPLGTDRFIALRVRRIVSEQLGVEYLRLHPGMRFVEDLGC